MRKIDVSTLVRSIEERHQHALVDRVLAESRLGVRARNRETQCTRTGCDIERMALGFCPRHYMQYKRQSYSELTTPYDAYIANTKYVGSCLVWTGPLNNQGEGDIWASGLHLTARQYIWLNAGRRIPRGMHVVPDRRCRPTCCRLRHLHLAPGHTPPAPPARSGAEHVYRRKNRWEVRFTVDGTLYQLGSYLTADDAAQVAEDAHQQARNLDRKNH